MTKRNSTLDAVLAFSPIATMIVSLPIVIGIGHPWLGILLYVFILSRWRTWWSCVLGLMNAMALYGGIIACLIPYVRMIREAVAH